MPYCRNCGAKVPEDARFCPSCGAPITVLETKPVQTRQTLKVTGKPKVVVTNNAPGIVEVKSGSDGEVVVDFDIREPEDLDWKISQEGNVVTVTCRAKFLPFHWPRYVFSGGPRANILVTAPAEADLDVEARLDRVAVSGIRGNIEANSSVAKVKIQNCEGTVKATAKTGPVELENVKGTISVQNTTGPIDLENVNGTVSVQNTTGPIRFSGALSKGENWFKTTTGSIQITLRGEPDLTVEAFTRLGRVTCSPELADARCVRGQCTGRIGAGTGKLIAETETGSITIRR